MSNDESMFRYSDPEIRDAKLIAVRRTFTDLLEPAYDAYEAGLGPDRLCRWYRADYGFAFVVDAWLIGLLLHFPRIRREIAGWFQW
jgi:hypothetical protein